MELTFAERRCDRGPRLDPTTMLIVPQNHPSSWIAAATSGAHARYDVVRQMATDGNRGIPDGGNVHEPMTDARVCLAHP
jgi:hypothetical protein